MARAYALHCMQQQQQQQQKGQQQQQQQKGQQQQQQQQQQQKGQQQEEGMDNAQRQPWCFVPLVRIPRADLRLRRDSAKLMEIMMTRRAHCPAQSTEREQGSQEQQEGEDTTTGERVLEGLCTLDELSLEDLLTRAVSDPDAEAFRLSLVDHNSLQGDWEPLAQHVVEVIDHHRDDGQSFPRLEQLEGRREIAFDSATGKATAASTCSLIVRRTHTDMPHLLQEDAELRTALLGVILLDSVNLDEAAGKVTPVDREAVETILAGGGCLTHTADELNSVLSQAKFDPEFWNSLSVRDTMRLDYKVFRANVTAAVEGAEPLRIGLSAVLREMSSFLEQHSEHLLEDMRLFAEEQDVDVFGFLTVYTHAESGDRRRQLLLYFPAERASHLVQPMVDYLCTEDDSGAVEGIPTPLRLERYGEERLPPALRGHPEELFVYDQGHAFASRKQVAPAVIAAMDAYAAGCTATDR